MNEIEGDLLTAGPTLNKFDQMGYEEMNKIELNQKESSFFVENSLHLLESPNSEAKENFDSSNRGDLNERDMKKIKLNQNGSKKVESSKKIYSTGVFPPAGKKKN